MTYGSELCIMCPMNSTTNTAKQIAPFKSDRAAKMAFTKAENAWKAKRDESTSATWTIRDTMREHGSMDSAEYERLEKIAESAKVEADALFEVMRAIYEQAKAQGIAWLGSGANWHFGNNPTRALIATNMD